MLGHELGTPIAVIDSSLQCLTINSGATESDSAKWLDNIRSSVKRMDNLVRDSLSRERVDSGGWDLRRTTLSASDLADAALSDYRLDLPLSGFAKLPFQVGGVSAELSIEIPETTLTCRGDIYLLHRAVHNLLENEGTEIPESVLPRLFEKYFRYGDRTNVAGAGLGLYLVRQVAELHGGQATAMTLPGQKLRFELDLPIFDHPGHE
jgi:signal transduction histidine kinase